MLIQGVYGFTLIRDGKVVYEATSPNGVFQARLEDMLAHFINGTSNRRDWFVGLMSTATAVASTDTLASHPDWTEFPWYQGNRKSFPTTVIETVVGGLATAIAQLVTLNTSPAYDVGYPLIPASNYGTVFYLTHAGTIAGAFVCDKESKAAATGDFLSATILATPFEGRPGDICRVEYGISWSD
jgi:hypothetical protein